MNKKTKTLSQLKKSTEKKQKYIREDKCFTVEQENEIIIALKELDAGMGIPHEEVMAQFKHKLE